MKVLISLSYYHPHISGLSQYAKNLAEFLSQSGCAVEVACCKNLPNLPSEEVITQVKIRRFEPTIRVGRGIFSMQLINWAVNNLSKYDLVIVNLPFPEAVAITTIAAITHTKVVSIFHCDLNLGDRLFDKLVGAMNTVANYLALQGSKAIIVNSLEYSDSIKLLDRFKHKIREINPLLRLPNQIKSVKTNLGKDYVVGFLGRISKEKNLETLIQAIAMNNDLSVKLVIAGPWTVAGENDYANVISNMVKMLGSRVEVWGEVDEFEKKQFFRYIDVLALPSNNATESFGMVQIEALANGVPVITTNLPGVKDIVTKTGAGLIINDSLSTTEWNRAIKKSKQNHHELATNTNNLTHYYDANEVKKKWRTILNF